MALKTFVSPREAVTVDGLSLTLTELTLLEVQQLSEFQQKIQEISWSEYLAGTTEIIFASAHRGDEALTKEELRSKLSVSGWSFALNEIMVLSGLKADPGKAMPVTNSGPSSIEPSSMSPAGDSTTSTS